MRKAWVSSLLILAALAPGLSRAAEQEDLDPYKMLRSMQFVQDSVVLGDHSAAEMQRFMLGTLDKRLRTAKPEVFEDLRNVDATLIYTMSGGNPATLEYLLARDVDGNFDNRVTDALRKYLAGKGALVSKTLPKMVEEYQDKPIGAYLALVSGNMVATANAREALHYYDLARLEAPGTIVEEAALRRSLSIAITGGMTDKAKLYARRYAHRFLHSPYASQFADLFVAFTVDHFGKISLDEIAELVDIMDADRQRETYLRMARRATIAGKSELALFAADKAGKLSRPGDDVPAAMASLYDNASAISTDRITIARDQLNAIPDAELSPRDRKLRAAADAVAAAVLAPPDAESLTQDIASNQDASSMDGHDSPVAAADGSDMPVLPDAGQAAAPAAGEAQTSAGTAGAAPAKPGDPESASLDTFVASSRTRLDEIDKLLGQESDRP